MGRRDFFFQAEDGIRDVAVTGVQTCALPISLMMLHGEVRRAAEITQHFLELAEHPQGAAEPSDPRAVLDAVLALRDTTLKELGVRVMRTIPEGLPFVACPGPQLHEMLLKLLDFSLRRVREASPPRTLQ